MDREIPKSGSGINRPPAIAGRGAARSIGHVDMPLLPETIWHVLRQNGGLRG